MSTQIDLVDRVRAYDVGADEQLLKTAHDFSLAAHASQRRESGDPYFTHPLEVARIVAAFKLDSAAVATALLHDTVEDTLATLPDIERRFGGEVAGLVDGVTKLSRFELQSEGSSQAENFRKLLLATSNDIRVLLVKLADRLHNMRTLSFVKNPDKRKRVAHETMEIYAPLAERIGLHEVYQELEDLAFAEINPEAHASVIARLGYLREPGSDLIDRISGELNKTLTVAGIKAHVFGREKRPYSIWRKMEHKKISFEQLADVVAFRVIVDTVAECYRALGVLHGVYPMVPNNFDDYISTPKPNDYRSLHTAVIGPEQQRIEVQIRTWEMHEKAELGIAAHWQYKTHPDIKDGGQYRWIRSLLEILDHASSPDEFLEHTKLEMFKDKVYCFTPKGGVVELPRGATPVDLAFAVHSDVGETCVGCRINGSLAALDTRLNNGDQVEILRSTERAPSPVWLDFVVTGKAKAGIRRHVRSREREEYIRLGRAILEKRLREGGHEYSEKALKAALKLGSYRTEEDLLAGIGRGELRPSDVIEAVFPGEKRSRLLARRMLAFMRPRAKPPKGGDQAIPIRGLIPGMAVHYATCCSPLPGDRIVGIVTTGKGVTVHTIDCETLEAFSDTPERWLDVSWDEKRSGVHVGRLTAVIANESGSLGSIASLIGRNLGNITNLKITKRTPDYFTMVLDIEVSDVKHMADIIAALRACPQMQSVERVRGQ
ncbi:MAG: bifunctional (p)ppGpp synthetase/guanosine-3',5'-bis(diphosphate) 3'-pyrophosphohydrolase [Alphaproteobacteria bacterium]|nr:bifunctional (p)ppGpp synthetase/guanosine-3',5'-bis(diphosphate) 3'-pyrophosphohydrolase [Alphaproteobacteria bacterium]